MLSPIVMVVLLIVGLFLTVAVLWLRKQPIPNPQSRIPKPKRQLTTTTRPARAQQINYKDERRLITLALAGGMAPGAIWPLLRGSPQARRRRVLRVARNPRPTAATERNATRWIKKV